MSVNTKIKSICDLRSASKVSENTANKWKKKENQESIFDSSQQQPASYLTSNVDDILIKSLFLVTIKTHLDLFWLF